MNTAKLKLTFLLLITLLPIALATWYFRVSLESDGVGTTNKGVLVSPLLELTQLRLQTRQGEPAYRSFDELVAGVDPADYDPRPWQLLFFSTADCDEACIERLYFLRQIHIRLGKESERVQRVLVLADPAGRDLPEAVQGTLAEQQPDLRVVRGDAEHLQGILAPTAPGREPLRDHYIYVADPVGNIMLYWTPDNTLEEIYSDIDKLLDQSSLG